MKRRSVIGGLAAFLLMPKRLGALETAAKIPRIGILSLAGQSDTKIFDGFRQGLADFGYIDGKNITIEYRLATGDFSRLPAMAAELARLPVQIIIVDGGANVTQVAHEATRTGLNCTGFRPT